MRVSPTERQLAWLSHKAFTLVRLWANHQEFSKVVADLADLAELIPLQLINRDERYLEIIVDGCFDLEKQHPALQDSLTRVFKLSDEEILSRLWVRKSPVSTVAAMIAESEAV